MNNPDDDSSLTKSKSSTSDLSSPDRSPTGKKRLSIKDFEQLKQLGKGSFAEVYLARNMSNNKLLAIKILDKYFMHKVSDIFYALAK
jgi:RAC serine/threonine-protein kinase